MGGPPGPAPRCSPGACAASAIMNTAIIESVAVSAAGMRILLVAPERRARRMLARAQSVRGELLQQAVIAEHLASSEDDGGQRVFDDLHRQLRFLANAAIEVAKQCAATAQRDAAIVD